MRTYQARLHAVDETELAAYGELFGRALRSLYARDRSGKAVVKPAFMRAFGLTSRQYNAVRVTLDGMERSVRECAALRRDEVKGRLAAIDAKLGKTTSRSVRHQLRRRRERLTDRTARPPSGICFGSRRLFNAQHHLEANGFPDRDAWLAAWRDARSSQFFVLGSGDETAGCQGCVAMPIGDGYFRLRLRLPNACAQKYLEAVVRFGYGAEHLEARLQRGQAISYRFVRDAKGWRVFASTAAPRKIEIFDIARGVVGIDLNEDHLAWSETDGSGNVIQSGRIALCTYGLSQRAAATMTAEAVKRAVTIALERRKPISIERLDFARKKAQLSYVSAKSGRMISAFAYRRFEQLLRARATDAGIVVYAVNPAYSSKIGRQKYARRYGLSVHQSAALVLARRAQGLRDRYVRRDGRHRVSTREDRRAHASVAKRTEGRGEAEVAPRGPSSRDDPVDTSRRDHTIRAGESPARQSSGTRVRPASAARPSVGPV